MHILLFLLLNVTSNKQENFVGNFGMSGNFGVPIFIFSSVLTNNKNVFIVILLLFIIYYYHLLTIVSTIFFSS